MKIELTEEVLDITMKRCGTCKKVYPKHLFYRDKARKDGWSFNCRYCESERKKLARQNNPELIEKHRQNGRKWYKENKQHKDAQNKRWQVENPSIYRNGNLKSRFNITLKDYDLKLKEQDWKCAICKIPASSVSYNFHVDHDHETGNIRGLLCRQCNIGLGHFNDDIERLISAVSYIKKYNMEGDA